MHISEGSKLLISKTGKIIIIALLGFLLIGNATNGYNVARANSSLQHEPNRVELQASDNANIYLPIVLNNSSFQPPDPTPEPTPEPPPKPQNFGVEIGWNNLDLVKKADEANAYWLRSALFNWDQIEPIRTEPPTYHWEVVNESVIREASARGIQIIATVKYTPSWAQKYPGVSCGPVAQNSLDAFAQFMQAVVTRYGVHDYNIKHWEMGNEPDVYRETVPPNNFFGCWGEINDDYYGGGYYAEMLKRVYPAVKSVDPDAQIHIGGLWLKCDPTDPYPEGEDCNPGNFLEGILRHYGANDGGNYFDIVNFNGYGPYVGSLIWDETWFTWDQRGGVVLGKAKFLREVMAKYGVDKPLFHSEAGLLCPSGSEDAECDPPGSDFYEAQADYVIWAHVRNLADGIMGTSWYTLSGPGWSDSGLLDDKQNPRPAYYSFQFMAEELRNADYEQRIWLYYDQYPFLRVYEFNKSGKRIWVMWASDEQPSSITLPGEMIKVFNKYGNDITPTNGQITIKSPVYVELTP